MPVCITESIVIPDSDIRYVAARSAGPGGQHGNKVNTRVILEFDPQQSSVLSVYQKRRIIQNLGNRLNQKGILRLQSQRYRSQSANRADVLDRFVGLLQQALRHPKYRIPTRVPQCVEERRLDAKKRRSQTKRIRKIPRGGDDGY